MKLIGREIMKITIIMHILSDIYSIDLHEKVFITLSWSHSNCIQINDNQKCFSNAILTVLVTSTPLNIILIRRKATSKSCISVKAERKKENERNFLNKTIIKSLLNHLL